MRGPRKVRDQPLAVHLEEVAAAGAEIKAMGLGSVPGHDEVTEGDMHIAIPLGLP